MLIRLFTGKLTIGIAILAIASVAVRFALQSHWENQRKEKAIMDRFAPAMDKMAEDALTDSDWHYTGPLGELDFHLGKGGNLQVTSGSTPAEGSWSIIEPMVKLAIPGTASPHQGIFRGSLDKIEGPNPSGTRPGNWSATRIKN